MESENIKYIPELDHIRAYASILIASYHSTCLIWFQTVHNKPFSIELWSDHRLIANNFFQSLIFEGHTAVALFLVLSGFIFTLGTYKKRIVYSKFIINRLLRTYPLFIVLLIVGVFSFPDGFNFISFVQTILGFANAPNAADAGSFSALFWTVAVEWQFYLIFPFLLIILNKNGANNLIGIIFIFIIMRIFSFLEGSNIRDVSYWTIVGRMDQFLIGIIMAVIYKNRFITENIKMTLGMLIIIFLMILSALFYFNQLGGWTCISWWKLFWPTIEGGGWGIFIILYLPVAQNFPVILSQPLVFVGKISYSIYLIHFTILQVVLKHNILISFSKSHAVWNALGNAVVIVLPITLLVSFLTYTFIEKPFLNMRVVYTKHPE